MATTYKNGHKIKYNETDSKWYYEDGKSIDKYKKCPKCGKLPIKGHDACLANLPGVRNACCGHGVHDGYIQFNDGTYIQFELKEVKKRMKAKMHEQAIHYITC